MSEHYATAPGWQPQPPAVRQPLTPRQKSGARLAGILGFVLLSLGWTLFWVPLSALVFGAFLAFLAGIILGTADVSGVEMFLGGLDTLDLTPWILPIVIAMFVGVAIMAFAFVLSARILRAHDVARPWPVTWAGAGIAIVASWVFSWLAFLPLAIVGGLTEDSGLDGTGIVVGVVSLLLGLAITVIIGWLSWWWMAHAMRRPAA